eukprot:CAMPEP_0119539130 /NCGR_PEP_ID=MMETSP1344-20130328/51376_1 /TAXON_ID=236787 /ORGANISM="Florenciella parvula, Strain CCMP2471" /LENGTH=100 /DNA_ID=CAMNT_0007582317 /DNA_START=86 /DNA_END=385 /DNA_ORIENTATION=-
MGGMGVSEGGARPPRPPPRRAHKSGVLYKEWDVRNGSRGRPRPSRFDAAAGPAARGEGRRVATHAVPQWPRRTHLVELLVAVDVLGHRHIALDVRLGLAR